MEQLSSKEHCQKFPRLTDFDHTFAQLKEFGKETEDNLQDGLCRACARFNWRQLIGKFFDRKISSPMKDWRDHFGLYSEENERVLATIEDFRTHKAERDIVELGDEWPSSPETRFPLAPLAWVTANRDICSLCGLITEAAANQGNGPMVPDLEDIIAFWFADDDRCPSSMFHVSTTRSLLQEVGDWWQLSFCFYDDGKAQIRTIREGSHKDITHPIDWFRDCISPRQIDFDIVKSWISNCEEKHGGCKDNCGPMNLEVNSLHYHMEENGGQLPDDHPHQRNVKDSAPLFNLRLIDVLKDEVIHSRGEEKYFALSYVWGTTTQYKALSKNFHKSLAEEHESSRLSVLRLDRSVLPQTIQDAMCLVQNLGERYLWVDVLCIMQDDPNEVTSTLRFMNKIYSDATLTIVAADGSAGHGLKGVRPNSRDLRSITSSVDTIPFMQETHILDMNNTAWAQRGWTFQEGIFAKKWLIFSNSRVFFACHERVVGEEQPEEPIGVDRASRQDYKISPFIREDPFLWVDYRTKVTLYTSRHLTYEGDVVDAFSGLMERYRELSGALFSSCLLTNTDSLFTLALLWRPGKNRSIRAHKSVEANTQSLVRRVSPVWRQGRDVFFPSWSWIGWRGPVVWDSPGGDYNDINSLNPAVSWPWGKPNMADSRKRADEKGVLDFDAEVAILSPADLQASDTVYLDDGTVWREGRRKCVAIATQTLTGMVFLLIVKYGADGIYSREGVCGMAVELWSELATREHLSLG